MLKIKTVNSNGFTLVELIITMVIMIIVSAAIGLVIVDNQNSWGVMYANINSDLVGDGFAARKRFDSVIRSSSGGQIQIADNGQWIEVNYFASAESSSVDRYGKFFAYNGSLYYEYGQLSPRNKIAVDTICNNVTKCAFRKEGLSVQMVLTLDNGELKKHIVTSALAHN